ncbi:MAG: arginine deiminase family protein [Bacteroidota bacterium]
MEGCSHAIVRKPPANFLLGQSHDPSAVPDLQKTRAQHMDYVWTLYQVGLEPELLEADEQYPDSCFVEDTAILAGNCAVICRPGHPSRRGEEVAIADILRENAFVLAHIEAPGTVDGGDVVRADRHFFIGLSARTNTQGARQLAAILRQHGFSAEIVPVVEALHLKSGISWLGGRTLLMTEAYAHNPVFARYERIVTAANENYAANCLSINGTVIISAGYPQIADTLDQRGYELFQLRMSEFRKMDGSLTCLSLIW